MNNLFTLDNAPAGSDNLFIPDSTSIDSEVIYPARYFYHKNKKIPKVAQYYYFTENTNKYISDEGREFLEKKYRLISEYFGKSRDYVILEGNDILLRLTYLSGQKNIWMISVYYTHRNDLEDLKKELKPFVCKKKRVVNGFDVNLISRTSNGFGTNSVTVKCDALRLENYNDDLPHDEVLNWMNEENPTNGRVLLLHGKPGTGKSFYIKGLCRETQPNLYYIPPNLFGVLTDPSFSTFLTNIPNSIFLIEDGEQLIEDRSYGNKSVSDLLQLSDGFLGDCINPKFIITFNADLDRLDKALLRKGRLFKKYEFDYLSVEKSQKLVQDRGVSFNVTEPMSLAEIYNLEDNGGVEKKKLIGFNPE